MSGPFPQADLDRRSPELVTLSAGETLHRFYTARWDPIFFDSSIEGRFNVLDASCGVLYAVREVKGIFAETFLRNWGRTLIDEMP